MILKIWFKEKATRPVVFIFLLIFAKKVPYDIFKYFLIGVQTVLDRILVFKYVFVMNNYPYLTEAVRSVLVRLRKEAGLSQQKLANLSSVARVYILQLEQGKFRPTLNSIFFLARGLGMSPARLVALIEDERTALDSPHTVEKLNRAMNLGSETGIS